MGSVVKGLDKALASMDLEKVNIIYRRRVNLFLFHLFIGVVMGVCILAVWNLILVASQNARDRI